MTTFSHLSLASPNCTAQALSSFQWIPVVKYFYSFQSDWGRIVHCITVIHSQHLLNTWFQGIGKWRSGSCPHACHWSRSHKKTRVPAKGTMWWSPVLQVWLNCVLMTTSWIGPPCEAVLWDGSPSSWNLLCLQQLSSHHSPLFQIPASTKYCIPPAVLCLLKLNLIFKKQMDHFLFGAALEAWISWEL